VSGPIAPSDVRWASRPASQPRVTGTLRSPDSHGDAMASRARGDTGVPVFRATTRPLRPSVDRQSWRDERYRSASRGS
jgi:hypothetical protein